MLNAVLLVSIILGISGQNVFKKPYTKKNGGKGTFFFSAAITATALLFFVVTASELHFDAALIPYSVGFAAAYATAANFAVRAISCGSLSLSSLMLSYSLLLPTLYGLLFLHDPIGKGLIPGIALLSVSLFLINKKDPSATFSLRWIIYVLLSFFGNGMCTVVQKMQQVAMNGGQKNEFMIIALAIVTAVMLLLSLIGERDGLKTYVKTGWYWAIICGALNGMVNLFVMILSGRMPVSLMFPLVSAGGIIVTYLVSKFIYKEKLTKLQFLGFLLGIAAIVFLNI